jgi:23S rRNA pseudouridine1911/1915/1917 synthase
MTKNPERLSLEVPPEAAGERIDRFLASRLENLSRSRIQALIRAGHVRDRRGTIEDPGTRVKPGDALTIEVPPPEPALPEPEAMSLDVLWEDEDLIVIDKPAGLVVHPAAGHASGTLVNALIAHCGASLSGIGGVMRPGIVHRLDKDTSGLLVIAKTDAAHQGLAQQFAAHGADGRLERAYLAYAWGGFDRPIGIVDAPLGRSLRDRTKIAVVRGRQGRRAVTHYRVVETYPGMDGRVAVTQVRLTLETGRTHQIRVHLAHAGHPLLGDPTYGTGYAASARRLGPAARSELQRLGRQALHATRLAFEHPRTGKRLCFDIPLPADLSALRQALGNQLGKI